jgi:hypothetical protein
LRRVLHGGGDDPDPAADPLGGDRGDRLLFHDGDGRHQRHRCSSSPQLWPESAPGADFFAGQRFVAPGALEFCLLVSIGLLGGAGQILMTHSYRFADASIIAAFDYVSMIWAATLGYAFFAETPSAAVLAGAAVVAGAGVLVLWRERSRRGVRPAAAPAEAVEAH